MENISHRRPVSEAEPRLRGLGGRGSGGRGGDRQLGPGAGAGRGLEPRRRAEPGSLARGSSLTGPGQLKTFYFSSAWG